MSERKRYHKDNAPTDDIITLINLVRQNPALYNYKLQPNQRRRPDILSGWQEVSQQMGNKYSVQEVRRKWKNLRDTYHQYRRRSPKCIEGRLSKWRYAKQLDFLSKVYQPKLKAHRNAMAALVQIKKQPEEDDDVDDDDDDVVNGIQHDHDVDHDIIDEDGHSNATAMSSSHHASSQITLVDETETFILTAYEESVADDTVHTHHQHAHHGQQQQHHHHPHHHHHHQQQQHQQQHHHHHHHQTQHDGSISSIELSQITQDDDDDDVVDDGLDDDDDEVVDHDGQVVDIVKHELDEDGVANGTEVDYEEVCLYEEASGPHCELGVDGSSDVTDSKGFHYIDADGFCIEDIETEPEPRNTVAVPLRATHHAQHPHAQHATHHFTSAATVSSATATATNSVLSGNGGVITADAKLKNLTLVTTTASASSQRCQDPAAAGGGGNGSQQQIALVDVTEATSTSVTISSTPAAPLNAATVSTTLPAAAAAVPATATLCNTSTNTPYNSAATATTILQLPALSCGNGNGNGASSISVASSSTLIKDDEQQQLAQALIKRDELDLFFDFLKKKMQYFSKTQITHIQMEFLNCVSRQEVADQDAKD
ncbi:dendritic arbor reduction protein 1 [Drosophila montana]|uniref:dendritic arbor reduction protein 1 n=1 Tax=Drosophila montana TaxID=40370 RepID=UPI00313D6306